MRVAQSVSGTKTLYLIDESNHTGFAQILEEIAAASGALLKSYLLGHDVLGQYDQTHGLLSLLSDGHGSTRQLVDALGVPVNAGGTPEVYTYNAYGELLQFAGTPVTNLLYSGEQRDFSTTLDNLRARPYDFLTGRLLRPDPILGDTGDPQSLHKYLYVHADPVNNIDPLGLFSISSLGIGIGAISVLTVLNSANTANAPGLTDTLQADQSNMALDLAFEFAGLGVGKVVARFVFPRAKAFLSPFVSTLFDRVSALGRRAPSVSSPISQGQQLLPATPIAGLLPGPAQVTLNRTAGLKFQGEVLASLRTRAGGQVVSPQGVPTIPDLPTGNVFGVTDIKNVIDISRTKQLRAQIDVADNMGLPFNLIISPRTQTISEPLQREIIRTGGTVFEFDDVAGVFKNVTFNGNTVVR